MRLKARRSHAGSCPGRGSRLRLTLLLATVAAFMLVPAAQAFAAHATMQVNMAGSGQGEVNSGLLGPFASFSELKGSPPIECAYASPGPAAGQCNNEFLPTAFGDERMALRAAPLAGYEFAGWTVTKGTDATEGEGGGTCASGAQTAKEHEIEEAGGVEPGERVCYIKPDVQETGEAEVTATFTAAAVNLPLTLKINGGSGTVASNPAGITCTGSAGTECSHEFEEGAEVTLTASPAAGNRFWYWENCPSPEGHRCKVTMSGAKEVGVQFLRQYGVSVSKAAGSEPGLVLVYPAPNGVGCDYNCSSATYNYPEGEAVTLAAYEYPGNHLHLKEFTGGTGAATACDGLTECSFTVGAANSSVEAVFVKDAQNTLSLTKEGGGLAFIKSHNGIYCSEYCSSSSAAYYSGEEVEVTWELGAGTKSIEWTTGAGTCTGSSSLATGSCTVTMSAAKSLVAKLE